MNRRSFVKNITLATAGMSVANLYGFVNIEDTENGPQLLAQRQASLDVIAVVDVLVVGGSAAGIAAAMEAAKAGAKVMVIAPDPYLGWDICGTLRLHHLLHGEQTDFSRSLLQNGNIPTPADVKRTLQNYLLDNGIEFLLSARATGLIMDARDMPAGIVISSRSGDQIIRAKTIIDDTATAVIARLSGFTFRREVTIPYAFTFIVVGNTPVESMPHRKLPPLRFKEKEYRVTEYVYQERFSGGSVKDLQRVEQHLRDITWDPDQVDASDIVFAMPTLSILAQGGNPYRFHNSASFNLQAFRPRVHNNLFVLNGFADVALSDKREMLQPANMIALGLRLGGHVAGVAAGREMGSVVQFRWGGGVSYVSENFRFYNRSMRPEHRLERVSISSERIPVIGSFDNVVVGGGTAGACVAISSARYGSSTLVVEYLHGLGGMGTLGLIGRYWVGYRDGFTKEIDEGVRNMAPADHPRQRNRPADWVKDWKMEWYRREIQKAGGTVWFGLIACGAIVEGNTVKGIVVATPFGKGAIMAQNVIDSTGSADIAIAAGSRYEFTDRDSVAVQGSGLPKVDPDDHYNNTDYTFTDDTDLHDITRTMVAGNVKFRNVYDIGKLPQTRERRRMQGDYTVTAMDMANERFYDDTISYHYSSFDTHGYTIDPYFIIKPPAGSSVDMYVNVPLRALLPKGLNNIIVTGLGASADRDARPVIRMQPCLQNQGYSVGYLASLAARAGVSFRDIDFGSVKAELIAKGTLPAKVATGKDLFPPSDEQIREAARSLVNDFLKLEVVLWDRERGLKILREEYDTTGNRDLKARCAVVLGFYGHSDVCLTLVAEISRYKEWDEGWNFRGMHQFGMSASYLDALVMSLGKTRNPDGFDEIRRLALLLDQESELSHFRAVAEAFADLQRPDAAPILHQLLTIAGVGGHSVTHLQAAIRQTNSDTNDNSTRNNSLRELFLARALYLCGDHHGLASQTLTLYANDLHGLYSQHAMDILGVG